MALPLCCFGTVIDLLAGTCGKARRNHAGACVPTIGGMRGAGICGSEFIGGAGCSDDDDGGAGARRADDGGAGGAGGDRQLV
jgi:hypothetical protein